MVISPALKKPKTHSEYPVQSIMMPCGRDRTEKNYVEYRPLLVGMVLWE